MKIKELIKILEDLDQEMEIRHYSLIDAEYTEIEGIMKFEVEGSKCYVTY